MRFGCSGLRPCPPPPPAPPFEGSLTWNDSGPGLLSGCFAEAPPAPSDSASAHPALPQQPRSRRTVQPAALVTLTIAHHATAVSHHAFGNPRRSTSSPRHTTRLWLSRRCGPLRPGHLDYRSIYTLEPVDPAVYYQSLAVGVFLWMPPLLNVVGDCRSVPFCMQGGIAGYRSFFFFVIFVKIHSLDTL